MCTLKMFTSEQLGEYIGFKENENTFQNRAQEMEQEFMLYKMYADKKKT